jgi:DNA-binding PadR family transcriptional regulator
MRDHADAHGRRPHGGRHGGHRGHHGGWGQDRMERGVLRFVLLDALREGPQHGYELIKSLEERTHGRYAPSPGVLYPTLQYLTDLGFIRATQESERRVYELTEAGQAEVDAQKERVAGFWTRFGSDAPSAASQHEVAFLQEALDALSRTIWSALREAIGRGDRELIRRVRKAVERCQEEVRRVVIDDGPEIDPPGRGEGAV